MSGGLVVAPKRWMVVTWAAILLVIVALSALYGGRNCEVPNSGPVHWLLKGRKFVPTHWKGGCREVRPDSLSIRSRLNPS
jgi:hypothetical protein